MTKESVPEGQEVLFGIHPVMEALATRRRSLQRILVAREGGGARLGRLLRLAREAGVPVTQLPRQVLARKAGSRAAHQSVAAVVSPLPYADPEELCRSACARPDPILVALDRIEDPRNLGAVLRAAAAAGADGVLLGREGTVGLTPAVAKASAGAVERLPVAREARLGRRLQELRQWGFRVLALDPRGPATWDAVDLTGAIVVLAGGEGTGVRRGLLEAADQRVSIPLAGGVDSLNVSMAVGLVLFEAVRQRRAPGPGGAA